ncbi:MAG: hypothetical protein JWM53_260 [bacterium]|nr:hypothetical protein [bacterium]
MRSFIALSLVVGLSAPAWARPDGNNDRPPPPSMMRSDVQMRMPVDGRADTVAPMRESRPEPWQRATNEVARPQVDRAPTGAQRMDLPLKSDVMQKAHPGDQREVTGKPQALDARVQNQKPVDDRMGRPEMKPALPIKTDVMMKQQHGDNRDSSTAPSGSAAKQAGAQKPAAAQHKPATADMTPHDREMLCKMAGLCMPQAHATDDVEDKTE